VRGEYGAHQERASGTYQLARVLGQEIAQRPFGQYVGGHLGVSVRQAVVGSGTGHGDATPAARHLGALHHHPTAADFRGRRGRSIRNGPGSEKSREAMLLRQYNDNIILKYRSCRLNDKR